MCQTRQQAGDDACRIFREGFNCGQAVFLAFCEEAGIPADSGARLSSCLGGGFSQTGGLCGAVSGACLAVSAVCGRETASREGEQLERQQRTYQAVQGIQQAFLEKYGAVDCPGLLDHARKTAGEEKALCSEYVACGAMLARGLLDGESL